MPNHVTNITNIQGNEAKIKKILKEVGERMDFEKIVPMPEGLNGEQEYRFALDNWGTKRNAYRRTNAKVEAEKLVYAYYTAWATPVEVLKALAKKYEVKVVTYYADEDYGFNCGILTITPDGLPQDYCPIEGSRDAEEFADETYADYSDMIIELGGDND